MEQATEWYHQRLLTGADAGQARDYLRSRGYDGEVVRRFRLGWAPDDWDALCAGLGLDRGAGRGGRARASSTAGAGSRTPSGPGSCSPSAIRPAIRWPSGAGSCPGSADPAKYKNSSETPIYSKRRTLYALNWAKQDIITTGEVVVCEGYTDVIGSSRPGWSGPWPPAARPWPRST